MNSKHSDGEIVIKGAKTHNLKNINVSLPRNKITVITGLSGSGKSSLAFDTIFAEGQRKYIESLSAYARQFLRQIERPDVEEITGLSPAISINQKNRSNNPRSTVATITEIYDYLRVLYSRIGIPYCAHCNKKIERVSKDEIVKRVENNIKNKGFLRTKNKVANIKINKNKLEIYSPVVIGRKGEYYQLLYDLLRKGYEIVKIDGKEKKLRERIDLSKNKRHSIDVLIDAIFISDYEQAPKIFRDRLYEAIERATTESSGLLKLVYPNKEEELISSKFLCASCGFSFPEIAPRLFSFNSPYGACEHCNGLGKVDTFSDEDCGYCNGARLREEALNVFIFTKKKTKLNIIDLIALSIKDFYGAFKEIKLTKQEEEIVEVLLTEIKNRAKFMENVGLEYLSLDRRASTLSGGEAQRIRLASQLGSGLVGALYVLDEPTIGLHQMDNTKLINTILNLKELGNTIIIVEHDEDTIFSSDYLIDMGPDAGINGGEVVVSGYLEKLLLQKTNPSKSKTLDYLKGVKKIEVPKKRRNKDLGSIDIKGATINNIKNCNLKVPLGRFIVFTGASGSGKSSLVHKVLYDNLSKRLDAKKGSGKNYNLKEFKGYEKLSKVVLVDQSPIGRTPRSTPVTYVGAFLNIRELFASTEEARYKGFGISKFSFNVEGGRCEKCAGNGSISIEMHFLPTVYVECDLCLGKRYSNEILSIKYKGKNISDVLNMSSEEAEQFFIDIPKIHDKLKILRDVGLSYLKLGQPSTTLSGGEAQRVKIAAELYRPNITNGMYILDEPTVGLHFDDVKKLIQILNFLVDKGNSVVIIEHNLDIIKSADYIIDMGPEGGDNGGKIVARGTPEEIIKANTHTGNFLKKILK